MYTEQELYAIEQQKKKRWLLLGLFCLVLLAGIVYSLTIRQEAMTSGLTCLMGVVLIFFYELTIKPLNCYATFLNNALHGRKRELDCVYQGMEEDISVVEGVRYYSMSLLQKDDDGDLFERMLYWDAQKPRPEVNPGDRLHIVYHDRMVADLKAQ